MMFWVVIDLSSVITSVNSDAACHIPYRIRDELDICQICDLHDLSAYTIQTYGTVHQDSYENIILTSSKYHFSSFDKPSTKKITKAQLQHQNKQSPNKQRHKSL